MPQMPPPCQLTEQHLEILPSAVHGMGTWTKTYIAKGSCFEYTGHRFTNRKWLDLLHKLELDTYVMECGERCWINGNPRCSELPEDYNPFGAMINEPPQDFPPNCEFVLSWSEKKRQNVVLVVTLQHLPPGYELYACYGSNHKY
jgi:hypothetical protein